MRYKLFSPISSTSASLMFPRSVCYFFPSFTHWGMGTSELQATLYQVLTSRLLTPVVQVCIQMIILDLKHTLWTQPKSRQGTQRKRNKVVETLQTYKRNEVKGVKNKHIKGMQHVFFSTNIATNVCRKASHKVLVVFNICTAVEQARQ